MQKKSFVNSKIEDELKQKDQIINNLLTSFQNFSALLPKNGLSGITSHDTSLKRLNLPCSVTSNIKDIIDELNKSILDIENDKIDSNSRTTTNDTSTTDTNSNDRLESYNEITLQNQLSEIRKEKQEKYKKDRCKTPITDSMSLKDHKDDYSSSNAEHMSTESHKWPKKTILVVGDSMLAGIDEKRMSYRSNVKIRSFPGATIDDMFDYIKPLLQKCPDTIILHIGTNNCPNESSRSILDKLLNLKGFILKSLPSSKIIISSIINRTDNAKASLTVKHLNNHLRSLEVDVIDNENINKDCLGKKGLHLNDQGCGKFAMNLIRKIKTFGRN